jgi:hypothetical protein
VASPPTLSAHTRWPLCLSGRRISRQIRIDENIIYIWTETA